ncbi:MAG: PEP-CTERM sorting domain-containing protein [Fimbriimonadaceae bacterium]
MRFFVEGVQAVPEPGTMVALGLGLAAMARRKRKAQVR